MDTLSPIGFNLSATYFAILSQISIFLPRALAALTILLIGALIARWLRKLVVRSLELVQVSRAVKDTPVEAFLSHADLSTKLEQVLGSIAYWLFMLLVLYTAVSVLGLQSLTIVLERVLGYIPRIVSAVVIIFLGLLVAGVLESVVKGSIRTIDDGRHARLVGKVASYLTMVIFVLAAVSELGIAEQFITILFIGFVTTITISLSLAIGLGSKEVVGKIVDEWYSNLRKDLSKK